MVNGLYDVPQTDSTSEAAMAALIVRVRASVPKPETIPAGASVDNTLAFVASSVIADVASALGDRATTPLLKWDAALDGKVRVIIYRDWLDVRGRKRDAGADDSIDKVADAARAYLARLAPSGDGKGKTENPRYVDSGGNAPRDAPYVGSSTTSDNFICRRGSRAARGCY